MKQSLFGLGLILGGVGFAGTVLAQPAEEIYGVPNVDRGNPLIEPLRPDTQIPALVWRANVSTGYAFEADIDGGGSASVSRWDTSIDLGVDIPVAERFVLSIDTATNVSKFDFSGGSGIFSEAQAPWDIVLSHSLSVGGRYEWRSNLTVFGSASIVSSGEPEASFDDTLTFGSAGGFSYMFSDDLSLGVGIAVKTQLEDDPFILPFPILNWTPDIDPQRRLSVFIGRSPGGASNVVGAGVSFSPDESLSYTLGIGAAGLGSGFRLDDDGPAPGGVGRDQSISLIFGVDWKPKQSVRLSGYAGVMFNREIELMDSSGNTLAKRDVDPSPMLGISLSLSF